MPVDRKLLELLICPVTHGPLEYDAEHDALISHSAKLVYPVHDGIAVLLENEALDLNQWLEQVKPGIEPVASHEGFAGAQPDQAVAKESIQEDLHQPDPESKDASATGQ